jgi:hypothetical protein
MSNLPVGVSPLGSIVYSNLILEGELKINDCLISVSNVKNVVLTPISGRNGTIKEYINRGDYEVRVYGNIVADFGNFFPTAKMREFRRIMELETEIIVSSAFLNHFNITTCVVLDYNVNEKAATRNSVPFNILMVSDEPIEIKVNA